MTGQNHTLTSMSPHIDPVPAEESAADRDMRLLEEFFGVSDMWLSKRLGGLVWVFAFSTHVPVGTGEAMGEEPRPQ